jgi:uncharacterized membrane protein YqjE
MIHPLLRLITSEPQLLGDHVEAYADLVGEEAKKTATAWGLRLALFAASLALLVVALVLTGVAIMLWAAVPTGDLHAPWVLVAVPVITFALAAGCILYARKSPVENAFDNVKKQLSADMAMLREVSVS